MCVTSMVLEDFVEQLRTSKLKFYIQPGIVRICDVRMEALIPKHRVVGHRMGHVPPSDPLCNDGPKTYSERVFVVSPPHPVFTTIPLPLLHLDTVA
jgi:hypothetical protein